MKRPQESHTCRAVLLVAALLLVFASTVYAAPAVSPTTNAFGYPDWYQDATIPGIRIEPCLDPADPLCVLIPDPAFNPALPLSLTPGSINFPVEFFYFVADSDVMDTPGCPAAGTLPTKVKYRAALEGSFALGVATPGQQTVFTRTRIVVPPGGLCPSTTYRFTTPYGTDSVTTDATGGIVANKKGATIDTGCLAAPCDFTLALASRVFGGFLEWDPAVLPAAPLGYLGDKGPVLGTPHAIIGSPPAAGPSNFFSISDSLGTLLTGCKDKAGVVGPCQVSLFTVSGKIAGPLTASPATVDFGGQVTGTPSTPLTITVTNIYPAVITPAAATITGPNALDFAVAPGGDLCAGVALAQDTSCTVSVTFTPSALGVENAQLNVPHNGPFRSPLTAALTGTGTAPGSAPIASLSAASLAFGPQRVRTASAAQTVTLSNTGTAPLGAIVTIVNADPALFAPAADQFAITADTCSGLFIAAGANCTVSVQFAPTRGGAATALLSFADNAAGSPQTVTLTGTATGGIAAVSTALNPFGYPDWYQDENGVQLQPCLDPADPFCVLLADPAFNPLLPLSLTAGSINFPVEFFYFVADSDVMDTPGCPAAGTLPTKVKYRAALEGSFALGVATPGDQSAFTRTRIVVPPGGLCPNTQYAFVTPYGTDLVTTDAVGGIVANKKGATVDTGCLAAPCDFTLPLSSRVMGGLLKWDPAALPAPPAGHIGDAGPVIGTPHAVVGSPYIPPGETAPANFFRIADPLTGAALGGCKDKAGVVGPCQVNLFTVSGKLAVPIKTSQVFAPGPLTFAPQNVGTASAAQTVTLTNIDPVASATISAATVLTTPGGVASVDFSKGADTCTGVTLAPAGTCTIDVAFNPTVAGPLAGVLIVTHTGLNSPAEVPLSGTGVAVVGGPALTTTTISAPAVAFPANGLVTVTVSSLAGTPTGNVALSVDGGAAITQALAAGSTTFTLTSPAVGTHTLSASYAGTATFAASSATGSLVVSAAGTTTTTISAPAVTFPANGSVTVTVSSLAGTPTGNVALSVDGGAAITQALVAGSTTFTLTSPAVGTHILGASYGGTATFAPSFATGSLVVAAATTTSISAPAVTFPANGSVTVTVSSLAGTPTGNVALSVDGGAAITQALVAGSTTFTLTSPAVGTHTLSASYAGAGNFAPSSITGSLVVSAAPEIISANAQAVIRRPRNLLPATSQWAVSGRTSVRATHTMTVTLTRTGQVIGTAVTRRGVWRLIVRGSAIMPVVGDTITVTSSLGTTATFPLTVR